MEPEATSPLPNIRRLLLAALGVAFAWVLLSLLTGLGSSDARAEQTDDGGALSALVTSVADHTTDAVTGAAAATTGIVSDVVETAVPAPPAVQAPVVETVIEPVVQAVTSAVSDAVAPGVVAPIVSPVVEVVTAVPVVGDLASGLGLDQTLPAVAADVDKTLQGIASTVTDTVDRAVSPVLPVLPAVSAQPTLSDPAVVAIHTPTELTPAAQTLRGASAPAAWAAVRTFSVALAAVATLTPSALFGQGSGEQPLPFGAPAPTDPLSTGPSGAGPGVWGMLALAFFVAYRAWVRRKTGEDDHAPAAPLLGTDVSPD